MITQQAPKYTKKMNLYNMLQDLRHVLVSDFRQDFDELFIRDSYKMHPLPSKGQVIAILDKVDKINIQKEIKYKTKKIRRVCLVASTKMELNDQRVRFWEDLFKSDQHYKDYKLMVLDCPFIDFANKYPFLCHSKELSKLNEGKYAEDIRSRMVNMKENQKQILYSFAKFPTEIVENTLFVGSIYNSNSEMQIKDLKIKSLLDLVQYKEDEIIPTFKQNYNYNHIPLDPTLTMGPEINFDEVNQLIDTLVAENKSPILIYCKSGEALAPGFAIAYLMYKNKLSIDIASMRVFQATSSVQISKWLYTQLLLYKPTVPG